MDIGIIDCDKTKFPNLALMKLSAWHKAKGDKVSWYYDLLKKQYDLIYASNVFTWNNAKLPHNAIVGGSGADLSSKLTLEQEHIKPDYSLYSEFNGSLGFTTRGCINKCSFCIVPKKEGSIKPHAEIREFLRNDSKMVTLLDNNILAHEHGIRQLEYCFDNKLKVDCNQGLDARIASKNIDIIKLLAKIKFVKYRFACDKVSQMESVEKVVRLLRQYSGKKLSIMVYILVTEDIEDAYNRIEFCRKLDIDPFAQPFRNQNGDIPNKKQKQLARWCNHKAIFKTVQFSEYK